MFECSQIELPWPVSFAGLYLQVISGTTAMCDCFERFVVISTAFSIFCEKNPLLYDILDEYDDVFILVECLFIKVLFFVDESLSFGQLDVF